MQHLDDAREAAVKSLETFLNAKGSAWRVLLIEDVLARLRLILWAPKKEWESARGEVSDGLGLVSSAYWSGDVLKGCKKTDPPDGFWQEEAWSKATPVEGARNLRVLERHRSKTGWFEAPAAPPWPISSKEPAIVLFYSFKGGVGRSTALAATALQLAARGEHVVVLDADLDAPGVGSLLAGYDGATAAQGIVDYLLEQPILEAGNPKNQEPELQDYYHRLELSTGSGMGNVHVFPAGTFGARYVNKLGRLDYGAPSDEGVHPFVALLMHIRKDLAPDWILVDARAGVGDVSGFLTGGLCHLHVLLGTLAEASWRGLELILERLGGDKVRTGESQAECILMGAMIPASDPSAFRSAVERFTDRARVAFSERYYAENGDDYWSLDDIESADAPHVPVIVRYIEALALFRALDDIAESIMLKPEPYGSLVERLDAALNRLQESAK
jgi:hypothetical protein